MLEQDTQTQISLEEILSSMVEIEAVGGVGLEGTLQVIGYEMTSQMREEGRIIWIHAKVRNPNSVPSIALKLSKDGLFHAPHGSRHGEVPDGLRNIFRRFEVDARARDQDCLDVAQWWRTDLPRVRDLYAGARH